MFLHFFFIFIIFIWFFLFFFFFELTFSLVFSSNCPAFHQDTEAGGLEPVAWQATSYSLPALNDKFSPTRRTSSIFTETKKKKKENCFFEVSFSFQQIVMLESFEIFALPRGTPHQSVTSLMTQTPVNWFFVSPKFLLVRK